MSAAGCGSERTRDVRIRHISAGLRSGNSCRNKAATPAVWGVAMLVPLIVSLRAVHCRKNGGCGGGAGSGPLEYTATPGPATSMYASGLMAALEKSAVRKNLSTAATARMEGQLAGLLTGLIWLWLRRLSLPAAATMSEPNRIASRAVFSNAAKNVCPGSTRDPSDIEMTWQFWPTAHSMPASVERPSAEP